MLISLTQSQDCLICLCSFLVWKHHILPPLFFCTPIKLWGWSGKSCSTAGALQENENINSLAPAFEEAGKSLVCMNFLNPS